MATHTESIERHYLSLETRIVVDFDLATKRSAIANDVNRLVYAFAGSKLTAFRAFKRHWDEMQFMGMHFGCTELDFRERFMRELYAHFMKHIMRGPNLLVKLGAFYGLYAIYSTQILRNYSIPLTPDAWRSILALHRTCEERTIREMPYLLRTMHAAHAFHWTLYDDVQTELLVYMDVEDVAALARASSPLASTSSLASAAGVLKDGRFPKPSTVDTMVEYTMATEMGEVEDVLKKVLPKKSREHPVLVEKGGQHGSTSSSKRKRSSSVALATSTKSLDLAQLRAYCDAKAQAKLDVLANAMGLRLDYCREPEDWLQRVDDAVVEMERVLDGDDEPVVEDVDETSHSLEQQPRDERRVGFTAPATDDDRGGKPSSSSSSSSSTSKRTRGSMPSLDI